MKRLYLFFLIFIIMFLFLVIKIFFYSNYLSSSFYSYDGFIFEDGVILKYVNSGGNVIIPDEINGTKVVEIADYAFYDLDINSVLIPDTVVKIGNYSFSNNNLNYLNLSRNVKEIGEGSFMNNNISSLSYFESTKLGYACFNNNSLVSDMFFYNENELVSYGGSLKGNVVIPSGTITIGNKAFFNTEIISVSIPNSVKNINSEAFSSNNLIEIFLPDSISYVANDAFSENDYLTSIVIDVEENSLINFPWGAFNSSIVWTK